MKKKKKQECEHGRLFASEVSEAAKSRQQLTVAAFCESRVELVSAPTGRKVKANTGGRLLIGADTAERIAG